MKPLTRYWTMDECDLLLGGVPIKEVAEQTGRTVRACQERLRCMRKGELRKAFVLDWTPEADAELTRLLKTHTVKQIAEEIGRTYSAVGYRMHYLGLWPAVVSRFVPRAGVILMRRWTRKEVLFIYKWAGLHTKKWVAKRLGRTVGAIKSFCRRYDVRWTAGATSAMDLCREMGVSDAVLLARLHRMYPKGHVTKKRWSLSDEEADEIRRVVAAGLKPSQIEPLTYRSTEEPPCT